MPANHPKPTGWTGPDNSGSFVRILDGHISTNRFTTTTGDRPDADALRNAHELDSDDLL